MITGDIKNKVDRLWDTFWEKPNISTKIDVLTNVSRLFFIFVLLCFVYACEHKHEPSHPKISFNKELSVIDIFQTDTLAKDTAYMSIDEFEIDSFVIKDSLSIKINSKMKRINQKVLAYRLATNNNELKIKIRTKRNLDTLFVYTYKDINIDTIPVAKVISGNCVGFYDINSRRNYREVIRKWIFENHLAPDSSLIERMNNLMIQFNFSGWKEYSAPKKDIPILQDLKNQMFKFESSLPGTYYYLFACKNEKDIVPFIKDRIAKNFLGAENSSRNPIKCYNSGKAGPNVLLLIGINKDWKYYIQPVGIVVKDNVPPKIHFYKMRDGTRWTAFSGGVILSYVKWPKSLFLKDLGVKINIPSKSSEITSSVTLQYGSFSGNNYFGYDIPFYIFNYGDLKYITINGKKINAESIINGKCTRIHFKSLNTGDNEVNITASDIRGNISSRLLNIRVGSPRYRTSYHNNDYDDLEDRVRDLEDRIEDLE